MALVFEKIDTPLADNILTKKISIQGMTCASCVRVVERSALALSGVSKAQVNLGSETGEFSFDTKNVRFSQIKAAIEQAGYKVLEKEDHNQHDKRKDQEIRALKTDLLVASVATLPLFYFAMAPMISFINLPFPDFAHPMMHPLVYSLISALLVLPVLYAGRRFFAHGIPALFKLKPSMDSLVAVGTSAAIIYSVYSIINIALGQLAAVHHLYFETAAVIITLILLGKLLEAIAKRRTSKFMQALLNLAPQFASLVGPDGAEHQVEVKDLLPGDTIRIRPGERIAVDGEVLEGLSSVDESMMTGESFPVAKTPESKVLAGTVNVDGSFTFVAKKVGADTNLAHIIKLVENAQDSKAPIARLADAVSAWFVPAALLVATLSAVIWLIAGANIDFVFTVFTSVLLVSCPCALGLATPTAIMVGTGKAAELGILFKNAEALETMSQINMLVFDKTGTLTKGKPVISSVTSPVFDQDLVLKWCAALEAKSEHPLAKAVLAQYGQGIETLSQVEAFTAIPGRGIQGLVEGHSIAVGTLSFLTGLGIDSKDQTALQLIAKGQVESEQGRSLLFLAENNKLCALFSAEDPARDEAQSVIQDLDSMKIETVLLSGDNRRSASAVAKKLGINRVIAELVPEEKAQEIAQLKKAKFKVGMVGDGVNDAPSLALADVGIALGSGTDVAMESADLVLVHNNLNQIKTAYLLSKSTVTNIKQNLFWAFAYNIILIPVAAGLLFVFGGPLMNPVFAALAMSLSSVSVVSNALRLKSFSVKKRPESSN